MKKRHPFLSSLFWVLSFSALLTLRIMAAFELTRFVFERLAIQLPLLVVQITNTFLGLLISGLFVRTISLIFFRRQRTLFEDVIRALERIARGDFDVYLEEERGNVANELVASVNKMARELGQLENMRQEFISNVSHEIQSPLTSIRGFARVLQNEELTAAERKHYLEIIEMESTRLSRLSDDLLKLTRLESDALIEPQTYRLDRQLRENVLVCEPQWSDKKLEMDIDLQEVEINADRDLLSQMWLNLINNAIKFTPPGGTIRIRLQKTGHRVEFRIEDNGIGISTEDRLHIFERFYKADKSRTHKKEGSGLGLSIVRKIVELHHGEIRLDSETGRGTVFTISLPVVYAPSE